MDHDAVLEALDLAAAEPGGLERLMAGDTLTAAAVASHLVGCDACTRELDRMREVSGLVREVVVSALPPDLRERTLAYVRQHGVPREPVAAQGLSSTSTDRDASIRILPLDRRPSRARGALGWVGAVAAAVLVSVAATSFIIGGRLDDRLATQDDAIRDLAAVTTATIHLTAASDVARVVLDSPTGAPVNGTLLFSPSSSQLVVVATGLTEPPAGKVYRCWVDLGAGRQGVGQMFFGGGLAYWVGPSPAVKGSTGKLTFGVSLVGADGAIVGPDPVLTGTS